MKQTYIPAEWIVRKGELIDWYRNLIGSVPSDYKKRPCVFVEPEKWEEYMEKKYPEKMKKKECPKTCKLGPLTQTTVCTGMVLTVQDYVSPTPIHEGETTMTTTFESERRYLESRLSDIGWEQEITLRKKFHLDPDWPKSNKEAMERLKAGKFTIPKHLLREEDEDLDEDYDGGFDSYRFVQSIQWYDPANPRDEKGYNEAWDAFEKAKQPVKDAIRIADPKDALKMLQDFEGTLH